MRHKYGKNHLTHYGKIDTIIEEDYVSVDGCLGNCRYLKMSGENVDSEIENRFISRLVGIKASCGITVNSISHHAMNRLVQRNISTEQALDLIENSTIIYPGNTHGTI